MREVFNIPKGMDRVLVRECEITPQKAMDVCQALVKYLVDSGMVDDPSASAPEGETDETG